MEVQLRTGLPAAVIDGIEASIRKAGATLTAPLRMDGSVLHVSFRKGLGALAIIAAAIAAAIVVVALVLAWKLWKLDPGTAVAVGSLWLLLIVGGIAAVASLYFGRAHG